MRDFDPVLLGVIGLLAMYAYFAFHPEQTTAVLAWLTSADGEDGIFGLRLGVPRN